MPRQEPEEEFVDDQVIEDVEDGEQEDPDSKKPLASGMAISIGVHLVVLFLFSLIMLIESVLEEDPPPVRLNQIDPPPKKDEPRLEREISNAEVPLDVEAEADKPSPINQLDVPIEDAASREEDTDSDVPKGREEAVADSEMGGSGAFMAIGAGGGASGMFGSRNGGGKKRALGKYGGSKGGESAVDAALRWFKKHQSPNGMWDVDKYPTNCQDPGNKCEPGTENTGEEGDVACSAYALLCFLGAGYDHRMPSKYKATVKKGIDWLVSVQKPDGLWGSRNYENAVATMAIAEAYAMSNDPALKDPAQKGVNIVLKNQLKDKVGGYGLGWDYTAPNEVRQDASVTGWNVMALKSAAAGGISVGNGMDGAKQWLRRTWEATNPEWKKITDPYLHESRFPYVWNPQNNTVQIDAVGSKNHDMACVGALCAVFLGHKSGDMMLESLCNYVMKHQVPQGYPCNTYYMYYNTLAIFQAGGKRWDEWNNKVRDMLVNAQKKSNDCFDGSWDFKDTVFHGHPTGRLLSTAYCCLSLEVYYRYLPVAAKGK
jgi:hypothetical protein